MERCWFYCHIYSDLSRAKVGSSSSLCWRSELFSTLWVKLPLFWIPQQRTFEVIQSITKWREILTSITSRPSFALGRQFVHKHHEPAVHIHVRYERNELFVIDHENFRAYDVAQTKSTIPFNTKLQNIAIHTFSWMFSSVEFLLSFSLQYILQAWILAWGSNYS